MIYFWMTLAAMGGFALGFLVCAMCTVSYHPTPEPPKRGESGWMTQQYDEWEASERGERVDVAARIAPHIRSTYVEDDGIALDETRAARAARHEGGTQDV